MSAKLRNVKPVKVYIVVFLCMVTKALHLKMCSDFTGVNFLDFTAAGASGELLKMVYDECSFQMTNKPPKSSHLEGLVEVAKGSLKRRISSALYLAYDICT